MDTSLVSYAFVAEKFKSLVMYLGLDPLRYKPHSFRIGAASVALAESHSEDAICRFGQWDSCNTDIHPYTFAYIKNQ